MPQARRQTRSATVDLARIVALILLWPCANTTAAGMEIQVKAVKSILLVGEPLILSVTATTGTSVLIPPDLGEALDPLKVLVDRGQGFVPYRERRWASTWRDSKQPLPDGQQTIEYVLSYDDNLRDWIFPFPGSYRLVVQYVDDSSGGPFRSNVLTVTVRPPTGDETKVHDALRRMGPQVIGVHQPDRLGQLSSLLEQFPHSVYLQESRINDLDARLARIQSGYDPEEILEAATPDNPPKPPDLRTEIVRGRLAALLPDAEAVAATPGPFQPEALLILAGLYDSTGGKEAARQTYERIVREFPERQAAKLAQEEVGDKSPPTLQLASSPATLWPPNHNLVRVIVTANVSDDIDASPKIKLISIACDDACNPEQDIVGAALSTDDREFQLRADRTGGGTGRTYRITYSATDASGNTTSAQTTVRVPHDQR